MQTQVAPTPTPAPAIAQVRVVGTQGGPTAIWRASVAQRRELADQLDRLQDMRRDLSRQLQEPIDGADRKGLETRITDVDARISALDKQIANADAQVANAAGIPGAVVEEPRVVHQGPPEEAFVLGGIFMIVVFLPLSLAWSRRIWRRGAAAVSAIPGELMDRLTRLDQAVDSIAVEVERIGEGQRFMTRVLGERAPDTLGLNAGAKRNAAALEERGPR